MLLGDYHESGGTKRIEGYMSNGEPVGVWRWYSISGEIVGEQYYD